MSRVVDALSLVLLGLAGVAFFVSVQSLGEQRDLRALFFLALGALLLKGATDLLKPAGAR